MDDLSDRTADPPYFRCRLSLAVTAEGSQAARARWGRAVMEVYVGPGWATKLGELSATAGEVSDAFGSPDIETGDLQWMAWTVEVDRSFRGSLRQHYVVVGGDSESFTEEFDCGPEPGSGSAPTVTEFVLVDSVPEPGRDLRVDLTIRSDVGLWGARLHYTGAWTGTVDLEPVQGATEWSTRQAVRLPWDAALGDTIRISLEAFDLGGQVTLSSTLRTEPLADTWPPYSWFDPSCFDCIRFGGDTVTIAYETADASPHVIAVEVGDPAIYADTTRLATGEHQGSWDIAIQPEWAGSHEVYVLAWDSAGNVYHRRNPASIHVIERFPAITTATSVPGPIRDLWIDEARNTIYVAVEGAAGITRLRLDDLARELPLPLPGSPAGVDLSPGGDSVVALLADTPLVAVLTPGGRELGMVPLDGLDGAWRSEGIRTAANGRWIIQLWTRDGLEDRRQVVEKDPVTGGQRVWGGLVGATRYRGLGVPDDRSTVVTTGACTRSYDAATNTIGDCWRQSAWGSVEADGDGTTFTDGARMFSRDGEFLGWAPGSYGAELSFAGDVVYGASDDGIHVHARSPDRPLRVLEIPFVVERVRATRDGSALIGWSRDVASQGRILRIELP